MIEPGRFASVVSPILDHLDSETWHRRAKDGLHLAQTVPGGTNLLERLVLKDGARFVDPRLKTTLAGKEYENPLMVAAGWDKEGTAAYALHKLGFSVPVIGSTVPNEQAGNPGIRQWMIAPGVGLNFRGLDSKGIAYLPGTLAEYQRWDRDFPIGISLSLNKDIPLDKAAEYFGWMTATILPFAEFIELNFSSPNTVGLRDLQQSRWVLDIVQAVNGAQARWGIHMAKPWFIKVSPDETKDTLQKMVKIVKEEKGAGFIATNTTNNPDIKGKYGEKWRNQPGGLSGDDWQYRRLSNGILSFLYLECGDELDLIGVGGVNNAHNLLDKIRGGAKATQALTALRQHGPGFADWALRETVKIMEADKIDSLEEIRGSKATHFVDELYRHHWKDAA